MSLFVSEDMGASWKKIVKNVPPIPYRGTSLIRNRAPLGTYSRTVPRALWKS